MPLRASRRRFLLATSVLRGHPLLGLGTARDSLLAVLSLLTLVLGMELVVIGGSLHVLGLGTEGPALAVFDVAVPILVAVVAALVAEAHDCDSLDVMEGLCLK
jgi:hypothetical protein